MFSLERIERMLMILMTCSLILGAGILIYLKMHPKTSVEVERFGLEYGNVADNAEGNIHISQKININEADTESLMKLKGVGKVLAGRIVEYRDRNGPFRSISGIKNVTGISERLFEKIKDDIVIE